VDMQTDGPTIFGNDDYKLDLDFDLDAQIVQQVKAALGKNFAVTEVAVDASAFSALESGVDETREMRRRILALPKAEGVDAYIFVLPDLFKGPAFELRGLVVTRSPSPFGDGFTTVGTHYAVGAFDAVTGNRIDYGTAQYPSSRTLTGHERPIERCTNSMWADAADRLSDGQKSRLRKEFRALVSRSIAYTLASAGLINKSETAAVTAAFDTQGDESCHPGP